MSTDDPRSIEARVRTATRAGASLIRDVPPLGAPSPVRLRRRPERAPRRWISWGVPLAAAAAVAAIALALVAVRQPGHPAPVNSGTATPAPATAVPRYYLTPQFDSQAVRPGPLVLGDDVTGKAIAVVSPPAGRYYPSVQGTADDGTFVVESAAASTPYGAPPYSWSLLRVTPGGAHPYQLTKLPVTLPGSTTVALAFALSPDGRELAVESTPGSPQAKAVITLAVYSAQTGARLRAWTAPTQQLESAAGSYRTLMWVNGGRQLVFSATTGKAPSVQLRVLDVAGTGGAMVADSRVLFTTVPATSGCMAPRVTPDGKTAVCATRAGTPDATVTGAGCAAGALRFIAAPVPADPSGQGTRVLYQYPGACHDALGTTEWMDASGSTIIGAMQINVSPRGIKETYRVGVIAGGQLRPLRIAPSIAPADYPGLVF